MATLANPKKINTLKNLIAATIILVFGLTLTAQNIVLPQPAPNSVKYCDVEINEELLRLNPHLLEDAQKAEAQLEAEYQAALQKQTKRSAANSPKYVISVVFHVLHENGPENISDEQIRDCIRVMNEDFLKQNADTVDVVQEFQGEIGFTNIEFRLALKDPSGNPTNGINRYFQPSLTNNGGENSKINQWDRSKYLNIWVVKTMNSGAAAYTYRPSTVNSNSFKSGDGIISLHDYVGSIGTGSYGRSRTLTHEVGHWINLAHTWGNGNEPGEVGNCNIDDGVFDTPNTMGNTSCNLGTNSCSSVDSYYGKNQIDNIQNYMDYSYCNRMFTKGQSTRMRTALESVIAERRTLWQPATLAATGVDQLLTANFEVENPIICFGDQVQFKDASFYNQDTWVWSFDGANLVSSTSQNPVVTFVEPGIHDIELTVSNSSKTLNVKRENYIWALPQVGYPVPYQNGFENPINLTQDLYIINHDTDAVKFEKITSTFYEGSNCIFLKNAFNQFFNKDEFIIGPVDVSPLSQIDLTWKTAYAQKSGNEDDILRVYVSADCGKTWRQKFQKVGAALATASTISSEFVPSGIFDWREDGTSSFNSIEKNSEALLIKFEFESDGGNNLYIDDIQINGNFDPVPRQEYPRDGELNVSANPLINWKAVDGVTEYEYQVDIHTDFNTSNLVTGKKQFSSVNPNNSDTEEQLSSLLLNTQYFWRVRSITNGTPSNWSPIWTFTVSANGVNVAELAEQKQDVLIYPNPNNGLFNISFIGEGLKSIEVYDFMGKLVLQSQTSAKSQKLDLGSYAKGIYFVKSTFNEQANIQKVIVK